MMLKIKHKLFLYYLCPRLCEQNYDYKFSFNIWNARKMNYFNLRELKKCFFPGVVSKNYCCESLLFFFVFLLLKKIVMINIYMYVHIVSIIYKVCICMYKLNIVKEKDSFFLFLFFTLRYDLMQSIQIKIDKIKIIEFI